METKKAGRPKLNMSPLTITLPKTLLKELRIVAFNKGLTPQDLIRLDLIDVIQRVISKYKEIK